MTHGSYLTTDLVNIKSVFLSLFKHHFGTIDNILLNNKNLIKILDIK